MTSNIARKHKDTTLTLRISRQQKTFLSQAAKIRHTTLTNFVLQEAFHAAQDTIADQVLFRLDDEQWELFCNALDEPAKKIESLSILLNEPSVLDA
ncbi:MAG: DUF1778 domain-containing protein [Alphaproteobacteria bacterium]